MGTSSQNKGEVQVVEKSVGQALAGMRANGRSHIGAGGRGNRLYASQGEGCWEHLRCWKGVMNNEMAESGWVKRPPDHSKKSFLPFSNTCHFSVMQNMLPSH